MSGAYSLQSARRSVSYAFAVFRSVHPPSQRHLDALATNGGERCGLESRLPAVVIDAERGGVSKSGFHTSNLAPVAVTRGSGAEAVE